VQLSLLSGWLAVLSIAALAVKRETLFARMSVRRRDSVAAGPSIGEPAPRQLSPNGGYRLALFLSSDCPPCHEFANGLNEMSMELPLTVAVSGPPDLAGQIAARIPPTADVLTGAAADAVVAAAHVTFQPFALLVRDGIVAGKAYPTSPRSLELMVAGEAA